MIRTLLSALALAAMLAAHVQAQVDGPRKPSSPIAKPIVTVNINTATAAELEQLPGIGAKTAARIVDYRQKKGPFKKIEELMNVQGIGEKSFLKLRPQLTVGTSPKTTRPEGAPAADWMSSRIWSICRTMPEVRASKRRPASVSTIPLPLRVNSSARSSCSRSLIWRLSAGCAIRSLSEALLRLPSSATQLNVLS